MIYAIPHDRDCVANHFMKTEQFIFVDENNQILESVNNPAAGNSSCSEKSASIQLLQKKKADAVIVRNIGERALGKLLSNGMRVFSLQQQASIDSVLKTPMTELTNPSEGRPSVNHQKKGGCSHQAGEGCCRSGASCGCGHQHSSAASSEGCQLHQHRGHGGCRKKRGLFNFLSSAGVVAKR